MHSKTQSNLLIYHSMDLGSSVVFIKTICEKNAILEKGLPEAFQLENSVESKKVGLSI